MNPLYKFYCRVFQTCFKLAIPILPYRKPHVLESVSEVSAVLQDEHKTSVLLVTDAGIRGCGLTRALEKDLAQHAIHVEIYDKTKPNPSVANVEEALELYTASHCQAIVAFGGGSAMDCAKAVGARVVYPHKTVGQLKGLLRVLKPLPLLIAIPTTAGTGSEVTITSVITDQRTKHKYTMNSFPLIPHYAVLDPAVTSSLPAHLTATTGMDALTHAVEAYIGNSTTKETKALSLEAVALIFGNITRAYTHGDDIEARRNMLIASHKAGLAFEKSYVGYVHAIAHSLGGQYDIAHGFANAVILPIVLEAYSQAVYAKLKDLAIAAGIATETTPENKAAQDFIQAIRGLNKTMGIPEHIDAIQPCDISCMAHHAACEANPLYPVPVLFDERELKELYAIVAGWQ